MISYNFLERMRSAKRSIHSIRTRGEVYVRPFHTIPESRDRVIALRKAPLSRMFLLLVMILGFALSLYNAAAADDCYGPVTGEIHNSKFHFTYESWMKELDTDDVKKYRFERCVQNKQKRELWVNWESTGLKGTCDGNDIAYIYFDEQHSENEDLERDFWYGPRPEELEVSTILRPGESDNVRNNYGRVYLAQFDGTVELTTLFSDQQSMKDLLDRLYSRDKEGFYLWSGGRIAVPTNPNASERLKEGNSIQPGEFVSVEIHLGEQFILIDKKPASKLVMNIYIDQNGLDNMNQINGTLPSLFVESGNNLLKQRLQLQQSIDLNKQLQLLQSNGDNQKYIEFQDTSPTVLRFPVQRISELVKFTFGRNDESHLIIPFGVTNAK